MKKFKKTPRITDFKNELKLINRQAVFQKKLTSG